ncbi:MAG: ketoacyl-ACP synthase III, partial [Spirosomataceae bacterium]
MFINKISHYLPKEIIGNEYFTKLNNLSNDWIIARTGIRNRRRTSEGENTSTMAVEAVRTLMADAPYSKNEIDLIVGATYTPYDT